MSPSLLFFCSSVDVGFEALPEAMPRVYVSCVRVFAPARVCPLRVTSDPRAVRVLRSTAMSYSFIGFLSLVYWRAPAFLFLFDGGDSTVSAVARSVVHARSVGRLAYAARPPFRVELSRRHERHPPEPFKVEPDQSRLSNPSCVVYALRGQRSLCRAAPFPYSPTNVCFRVSAVDVAGGGSSAHRTGQSRNSPFETCRFRPHVALARSPRDSRAVDVGVRARVLFHHPFLLGIKSPAPRTKKKTKESKSEKSLSPRDAAEGTSRHFHIRLRFLRLCLGVCLVLRGA